MTVISIVQARMGSTRFPNKVMRPIQGVPMIELLLNRLSKARRIDKIILATSNEPRNQPLVDHVRKLGYEVFQGSENDVLDRYYQAAKAHDPDIVVRITGDCPLVDPTLVDAAIIAFKQSHVDYLSNTNPPTYPDGLDIEVFSFKAMEQAWRETDKPFDREHVTPYLRGSGRFSTRNLSNDRDCSGERWTVDEAADFEVIAAIFTHFHPRTDFSWQEVMALRQTQPTLFQPNQHLVRNEGAAMGTGQKLWKRAKRVIPGGNMLLSKRPEMFLPEQWPSYYSRAKGVEVWDLDGNRYVDMSYNGIGACVLGAADDDVDAAVKAAIDAGSMSTLNAPEEVELAELLCELHPWAGMVRYARSGGEAMAIAVRIARAQTGRDHVAFCGYHGWHDWYLAANLAEDHALDGHLLPGLEPAGVPRGLQGTAIPFRYNQIEDLESIVASLPNKLAAIVMEPIRDHEPKGNFLHVVREIASRVGAVLIFDEITAGWRLNSGGAHLLYGVEPDIAAFGKGMSNGYAMSAVIGRRSVMEAAQKSFISSTYWTERVGPTAAIATIRKHRRYHVAKHLIEIGQLVQSGWEVAAKRASLKLEIGGIPPLGHFSFLGELNQEARTLFTQLMLERGFLATNSFYASFAHQKEHVISYLESAEEVFNLIGAALRAGSLTSQLQGPVAHTGFQRLT